MKKVIFITEPAARLGFSLAGIAQNVAEEPQELEDILCRAVADSENGLVVIDERLTAGIDEKRMREIETAWHGVIVVCPGWSCGDRGLCGTVNQKGCRLPCEDTAVTGRILGISGPTVSVDAKGLKLYERVYAGYAMLTGEVVRLEQEKSVIQVYEDTRGLAIGEPVKAAGMPLTVRLGAGLISGMFATVSTDRSNGCGMRWSPSSKSAGILLPPLLSEEVAVLSASKNREKLWNRVKMWGSLRRGLSGIT